MSLDQLPFAGSALVRAGSAIRVAQGHRLMLEFDRRLVGRYGALALFAILSAQSLAVSALYNRSPFLIVAWPILIAVAVRRPILAMLGAGLILRLGYLTVCCTDQVAVSQAAWERVLAGLGGPYGVGYAVTVPAGAPFPYGPLGLVWWLPGPIVELSAAVAVMGVLAWQRALLTLAVYSVWQPLVWLSVAGTNDYSPGLLLLIAVIVLPTRPALGASILAIAAALKPYAFAWFLPAVGIGGGAAVVGLLATSAIAWSPLFLFWGGVGPYLDTIRLAARAHPIPNALDIQPFRWLALPIGSLALAAKRWEWAVLLGTTSFVVFLFFDRWASYSYWFAVIPVTGLAIESLLKITSVRHPARMRDRPRSSFLRYGWALPPGHAARRR